MLLGLVAAGRLEAQDAPHHDVQSPICLACHSTHEVFGNQIGSTAGNANLCLSCHQPGGTASKQALVDRQQAELPPVLAGQPAARGNSHRWDSGPAGRIIPLRPTPMEALTSSGVFTRRYAASYTVSIITPGNAGEAQFAWTRSGPGAAGGTNLLTGTNVFVEAGLFLSFRDRRQAPAFVIGDQWQLLVRPGLQLPTNVAMLHTMSDGKVVCSTCHDQHFQTNEPFDAAAPPYVAGDGKGRHFLRTANDQNQMCVECHGDWFVTNAVAGSHPMGILVATNPVLHPPATLPLDKSSGKLACMTCHEIHNSASADGWLLRRTDGPQLCAECHALTDLATPASHLNPRTGALWPGGTYGSQLPADPDPAHRGGCGNCHRVHGWPDAANPATNYPSLLVEREENLCFTCHDGLPNGKNLRANFDKTYKHPVSYGGRHSTTEDGLSARYGTSNRHSECADCHNVHQLSLDPYAPTPPQASTVLRGVARISVTNHTATSVAYTFRAATNPAPVKEYEVCFTCHSGWTTRPAGQADYAAEFNTKIASYHPVEGVGKNTNINANAFVNGWKPDQLMTCTDCHTSDDTSIRGPHGSAYQFILKKYAAASTTRRGSAMATTELCFDCHNYDTYANNSASTTVKNYSRFGGGNGHAYHVGSRRYSCYNCHETHGATSQPNLLVTGRSPGITTYTRTANGGSCVATCHGSESYTVRYAR